MQVVTAEVRNLHENKNLFAIETHFLHFTTSVRARTFRELIKSTPKALDAKITRLNCSNGSKSRPQWPFNLQKLSTLAFHQRLFVKHISSCLDTLSAVTDKDTAIIDVSLKLYVKPRRRYKNFKLVWFGRTDLGNNSLLLFHFFKWSYRFDRIRFEANLTLAIEQEF